MVEVVRCEMKYWDFIRDLRNDERVKKGFIQQGVISKDDHYDYMHFYGNRFCICLVDNEPAGYARVIDDDIAVCVHPDHQRRGVGVALIEHIKSNFPKAFAKIKLDNEASIGLFEKCGFKKKYYILER